MSNLRIKLIVLFLVILLSAACTQVYIVVTPTPENGSTVVPTEIPTVAPTPTQEVISANPHRNCAEHTVPCYVNLNPHLLDAGMVHTTWNKRALDVPEGYRPKMAGFPPPFVYCHERFNGCQFEFQWTSGTYGYQVEELPLYPDVVYMVKMVYSIEANCSQGTNCSDDQLSIGSLVFVEGNRNTLPAQPTRRNSTNKEALWAIQLRGNEPAITSIQTFITIQWATFAEPAKFVIHEIGVIAMPEDFNGEVIPIGGVS